MRKKLTAIVLAVLVFSLIAASAASLGGITTPDVGADVETVASCDTDGVTVAYTTAYDTGDGRYEVTAVAVSGIDAACDGQTLSVTLSDGTTSEENSVSPVGTSGTEDVTGFAFDAEALNSVAIVISG